MASLVSDYLEQLTDLYAYVKEWAGTRNLEKLGHS